MIIEDALNNITDENLKIDTRSNYTYDGNVVPRVTEILSSYSNGDYLMVWANSLGFKRLKYRDELDKAANIGSDAHGSIEAYMRFGRLADNIPFRGFLIWYGKLKKANTIEILGMEESIACKYFGGTYDCLMKINGKIYLIDYKTSNHVTFKYFMQLAAYRYMLYHILGINIDGVIILQLDKRVPNFTEYVLDFSIIEHYQYIENCTNAFLSLVYSFYNAKNVEQEFNNIFNKGIYNEKFA